MDVQTIKAARDVVRRRRVRLEHAMKNPERNEAMIRALVSSLGGAVLRLRQLTGGNSDGDSSYG